MIRRLVTAGFGLLLLAAPAHALPPEQETAHVVTSGETLNGIANRAGVPREEIIKANDLKPPYIVRIGETLTIPREDAPETASRPDQPVPIVTENHVVTSGETLSSIATRAKIPRVLIAEANGLKPPYTIRVGQTLVLPRTRHHTVKPGETGFGIAEAYGVPWEQIAIANDMEPNARLLVGKVLLIPTLVDPPEDPAPAPVATPSSPATQFIWPVTGPIRRGFKPRGTSDYHDGIDIIAPRGTAVRAVAAGTVIFARKEPEQFGNLVVIDHDDGWHSAYGSLGRITVKKGHKVARGERIGLVGNTSVTRKTELHFELRKAGKPVDPMDELPEAP